MSTGKFVIRKGARLKGAINSGTGDIVLTTTSHIIATHLPTSSAGLPTRAFYNSGGFVKVA